MIQKVVLIAVALQASMAMAITPNNPVVPSEEEKTVDVLLTDVPASFHQEIRSMNAKYRFVRKYESDNKTYFLYAEDVLGQSTYLLLGVDGASNSSFVMGVD